VKVDAGAVLGEPRHLASAVEGRSQLLHPVGKDALDVVLPQPETVRMPGRKVADIQAGVAKPCNLRHLPLGEEPPGDTALVQDLNGP